MTIRLAIECDEDCKSANADPDCATRVFLEDPTSGYLIKLTDDTKKGNKRVHPSLLKRGILGPNRLMEIFLNDSTYANQICQEVIDNEK